MALSELITRGFAFLAFLLAYFTLSARDRRTPYLSALLYPVVSWFLVAIVVQTVADVLSGPAWVVDSAKAAAPALFLLAVLLAFRAALRVHNRQACLLDEGLLLTLSHSGLIRKIKAWVRSLRRRPSYDHQSVRLEDSLRDLLAPSLGIDPTALKELVDRIPEHFTSISVLNLAGPLNSLPRPALKTCCTILESSGSIQYCTAIRNPVEFAFALKREWNSASRKLDWKEAVQRVVLIDAFSPHFGFRDSIHREMWKQVIKEGIAVLSVRPSFAGIHASMAKAFNVIKSRAADVLRRPSLVLYEGLFSLVDLESPEQYRVFFRHVVPSERMWGGMVTYVVEYGLPAEVRAGLSGLYDIQCEVPAPVRPPALA